MVAQERYSLLSRSSYQLPLGLPVGLAVAWTGISLRTNLQNSIVSSEKYHGREGGVSFRPV